MNPLQIHDAGGVITLTLDRPAVRNAINDALMAALDNTTQALMDRKDLVAIILTGAGEKAFCAGGDLRWLQTLQTQQEGEAMSQRMQNILHRLADLPVPVIGVLNGHAIGGGTEIALACDIRIIESHAWMCWKQARMGLLTGWGGGSRLLRAVGYARALELVTTCRRVSATEACALGLANDTAPTGSGLQNAKAMAHEIRKGAPGSVAAFKNLFQSIGAMSPQDAATIERMHFRAAWDGAAHREAVSAFFEKRSPMFRNRNE